MVQATVALHNFMIMYEEKMYSRRIYACISTEDNNIHSEGLNAFLVCTEQNNSDIKIRDRYSDFLMGAGAVSFQWKKALNVF